EADAAKIRSDFERARQILAALRSFWPADNRIQTQLADVDSRAKVLEDLASFNRTYAVIHSHGIVGSCRGLLMVDAFGMSYRPDNGTHGFEKRLKDIRDMKKKDGGESLEFKIDQKTLSFKFNKDISRTGNISIVDQNINDINALRNQFFSK